MYFEDSMPLKPSTVKQLAASMWKLEERGMVSGLQKLCRLTSTTVVQCPRQGCCDDLPAVEGVLNI